jgi:2-oxoglutarate dehydrogenase E1 component
MFHLLRRQMLRNYRKPLIVMTPKSLLRHRLATSSLDELTEGRFHPVIPEIDSIDPAKVVRILICSGKVYYDLLVARRARGLDDVAILRIEQLYPFPKNHLKEAIAPYKAVEQIIWCQEEPQNQGAWDQIKYRLHDLHGADGHVFYVGRRSSAAPAVGLRAVHVEQQERLVDEALTGRINPSMNVRITA